MKVENIMQKIVYTVDPDSTLFEALRKIREGNVNGLVVVEMEKIKGVITRADIFRAILPSYLDLMENERYMSNPEYIEERVERLLNIKVREIMTPNPYSVEKDTPIIKAGAMMVARKVKQLPVVEHGKLCGIVALTDVLNHLTKNIYEIRRGS